MSTYANTEPPFLGPPEDAEDQEALAGRPVDRERETFTRDDFLDELKRTSRRTKDEASEQP